MQSAVGVGVGFSVVVVVGFVVVVVVVVLRPHAELTRDMTSASRDERSAAPTKAVGKGSSAIESYTIVY
jgi:membrane-associated phospholipid phosphatase